MSIPSSNRQFPRHSTAQDGLSAKGHHFSGLLRTDFLLLKLKLLLL